MANLTKKSSVGFLRSSAVVSSMTMLSRVLGLVRDNIFARFLGADASADAFFVAFKIPNFFRRLFAEGAFSQAFVPVLSEYREQGSAVAVRNFIDRIAGCLGVSLLLLCSIVVIASPVFTALFGFGFYLNDAHKFWLTAELLRITFPYLLLISLTGLSGAILNSYDQFAVPAITPVFLNIVLIVAAAIVSPQFEEPAFVLAWGVLIAGIVQLSFQLPFLRRIGMLPHPKVDWSDESVRKVLRLMGPAMFGVSVSQINLLFDTILASLLPTGSVSWLYFSDRLVELPLGVFGVGIATVILPSLSRQYTRGSESFSLTIDWSIRMILLIALPATLALLVLAEPLLFTLLQYGKTTSQDVAMASISLRAYALGLVAFMLIKIFASSFFARQDTKTPVKIGVVAMLSNMVLNVIFVAPLHFYWQIGHVGLALATSVSAFINAGLLFYKMRQEGIYQPSRRWFLFFARLILANTAMVISLLVLSSYFEHFSLLGWVDRAMFTSIYVLVGGITYATILLASGFRLSDLRLLVDENA